MAATNNLHGFEQSSPYTLRTSSPATPPPCDFNTINGYAASARRLDYTTANTDITTSRPASSSPRLPAVLVPTAVRATAAPPSSPTSQSDLDMEPRVVEDANADAEVDTDIGDNAVFIEKINKARDHVLKVSLADDVQHKFSFKTAEDALVITDDFFGECDTVMLNNMSKTDLKKHGLKFHADHFAGKTFYAQIKNAYAVDIEDDIGYGYVLDIEVWRDIKNAWVSGKRFVQTLWVPIERAQMRPQITKDIFNNKICYISKWVHPAFYPGGSNRMFCVKGVTTCLCWPDGNC